MLSIYSEKLATPINRISESLIKYSLNSFPVYGEVRITRSCGYLESKRTKKNRCEQVSFVKASESRYCECNKDLCNSGGKLINKFNLVALTSVLLVIRMFCL